METLLTILIYLSILPILLMVISILVLASDHKYYKKSFNTLKNKTFKVANSKHYNQVRSTDNNVIWFANIDEFLIHRNSKGKNVYIHNDFITYLNPYSYYWFCKYKKWFRENCFHLKKN